MFRRLFSTCRQVAVLQPLESARAGPGSVQVSAPGARQGLLGPCRVPTSWSQQVLKYRISLIFSFLDEIMNGLCDR